MKLSATTIYHRLQQLLLQGDAASLAEKQELLKRLQTLKPSARDPFDAMQDVLLFMAAHPQNAVQARLVQAEMNRLSQFLRTMTNNKPDLMGDTGLPYTRLLTRFSHDILCWLQGQREVQVTLDSFDTSANLDLNTVLKATLSRMEQEETSAGLSNENLLDSLEVKPAEQLHFMLDQLRALDCLPAIQDHCWESLKVWVRLRGVRKEFSRWYNRMPVGKVFYQDTMLKQVDAAALLRTELPMPEQLSPAQSRELCAVIRRSLLLTLRETDPATYMEEASLRYYVLERGISVAIYGMQVERQLALQSYVGYTLFKNGYPAAYGGSWIFGRKARFGLNIFEAFRGGESGYMMCQLLRVYVQAFGLDTVEVDPDQFGRDNPDGIRSGAFWFYYRYGFRPTDSGLQQLAEREQQKIKKGKGHRSSEQTLRRFTASDLRLSLKPDKSPGYDEVYQRVTKLLRGNGGLLRRNQEALLTSQFVALANLEGKATDFHPLILAETAQLYLSLKIRDKEKLQLAADLMRARLNDPYTYNRLLTMVLT